MFREIRNSLIDIFQLHLKDYSLRLQITRVESWNTETMGGVCWKNLGEEQKSAVDWQLAPKILCNPV